MDPFNTFTYYKCLNESVCGRRDPKMTKRRRKRPVCERALSSRSRNVFSNVATLSLPHAPFETPHSMCSVVNSTVFLICLENL
jgi:hypothetical protein